MKKAYARNGKITYDRKTVATYKQSLNGGISFKLTSCVDWVEDIELSNPELEKFKRHVVRCAKNKLVLDYLKEKGETDQRTLAELVGDKDFLLISKSAWDKIECVREGNIWGTTPTTYKLKS